MPKKKWTFGVLQLLAEPDEGGNVLFAQVAFGLASTAEAVKWIRERGEDDTIYVPYAQTGDAVAVKVETTEKRELTPLADLPVA